MNLSRPRNRRFRSGKLALHVLDWGGHGLPLVLLHGGSAHARWWDYVAPQLTSVGHVYALDFRGHGESDWAKDGAYRVEDYAADVGRMIQAFHLERPVLIGHSLGSFVVLRYGVDHPRSLAGLVSIDGRASFSASGSRYMQLLRMFAPAEYATLDEAVERFQPLPRETNAAPEVLQHVARHGYRRDGSGRWIAKFDRAALAAHLPFDLRDRLPDLEFPVLFVRGEKSRVLSAAAAARLAASCRRGRWVEIPDAHHHVLLDAPELLVSRIREFLAEILERAAHRDSAG